MREEVDVVGEAIVPLLLPFLVIGTAGLLLGLMTLAVRRRTGRRPSAGPTPQPEAGWRGVPVEPLLERPVDPDRRRD